MNATAMRRRLRDDGLDDAEIEDRLADEAERQADEARDRHTYEDLYQEKP